MQTMSDKEYRRRLIARVEALRTEADMPMLRFHQQLGPVAARKWIQFVNSSNEEAWHYFSVKAVGRIAEIFGVGVALFQFTPKEGTDRSCRRHCADCVHHPNGTYGGTR
jgi:hypothetical protein